MITFRNPFKPNYAKRIAGALGTFAKIKTDLMDANTEIGDKVNKNNSKISKLNSSNEVLGDAKSSNESIIASVTTIIKKSGL